MNIENQIIQLRLIEHQIRVNDYSDNRAAAIIRRYKRLIASYRGKIQLNSEKNIEDLIKILSGELTSDIVDSFSEAGYESLNSTKDILSWDGNYKEVKPVKLSKNQIAGIARTQVIDGAKLTEHLDTAIGKEVRKVIANARVEGKGIAKMTGEMWHAFDGKVSRRNLETISRTYTATASSYTKELTYAENSDVIKGYRLTATLENGDVRTGRGTCPRCAAMDQQYYDKKNRRPSTPFHPNCRCLYLPETITWGEMGLNVPEMEKRYRPWTERARNRKKIEMGTTQFGMVDFFESKPDKWQNKLIGPRRAQMVRDGLIKFDDIVDRRTSELYTIKQLKQLKHKYKIED